MSADWEETATAQFGHLTVELHSNRVELAPGVTLQTDITVPVDTNV